MEVEVVKVGGRGWDRGLAWAVTWVPGGEETLAVGWGCILGEAFGAVVCAYAGRCNGPPSGFDCPCRLLTRSCKCVFELVLPSRWLRFCLISPILSCGGGSAMVVCCVSSDYFFHRPAQSSIRIVFWH